MTNGSAILYRGFDCRFDDGEFENIFIKTPRTPKATNAKIHQLADEWFFRSFGVRGRSAAILCSTDAKQALRYRGDGGTLATITPIGNYRVIYSLGVHDFLDYFVDGVVASETTVKNWLESKNYACLDNLNYIPPGHAGEVMLHCEKYILKNIEI
ncbi:hypothetical protein [Burkholderia sp. RF2-non_BP3]|uniref:hypothetical protein n=1 Tax=Burkholderia sp. RF2-non_BP3 TaxID=1637844 RepID=UPI0012E3AD9A|nr:hypothetical protein [Burkholderia sp. RF2-non_BP3]